MQETLTASSSFSIRKSFEFAWQTLLKRFWFLLALHFTVGGIPALIAFSVPSPYHEFICQGLQQFFMGGFIIILLALVDGGKARYSDLFSKTELFWRFMVASICFYLIAGLGLILLVVPGIIAMLSMCVYDFCIAEERLGPIEALKRSCQLTKGCRWKLLGFVSLQLLNSFPIALVTCLLLAIPALLINLALHLELKSLIAGVLWWWVPPVVIFWWLSWAHCYRQLTKRYPKPIDKAYSKAIPAESKTVETLVKIAPQDSEFRRALAACLIHEERVKVNKLTEEQFEEIAQNYRKFFLNINANETEAEMTSALWFRAARWQRLRSQFQGLQLFWFGLNVYLFWGVGFQQLLTWKAAVWLVVGTLFILSVVGFLGSAIEQLLLPIGVHYKVTRGIKYLIMFCIFKPIFNLIFTGRL